MRAAACVSDKDTTMIPVGELAQLEHEITNDLLALAEAGESILAALPKIRARFAPRFATVRNYEKERKHEQRDPSFVAVPRTRRVSPEASTPLSIDSSSPSGLTTVRGGRPGRR